LVRAHRARFYIYSAALQIFADFAQQFLRGQRLETKITGGTRCLPAFDENDPDIRAHGYCEHSFWEGLTPEEWFFTMAGGREGLIDTSQKTSETGDIQRKLIKSMENLAVAYDGSMRNISGTIIQYACGDDGFDTTRLMKVNSSDHDSLASFIDFRALALDLNAQAGWIPADTLPRIYLYQGSPTDKELELSEGGVHRQGTDLAVLPMGRVVRLDFLPTTVRDESYHLGIYSDRSFQVDQVAQLVAAGEGYLHDSNEPLRLPDRWRPPIWVAYDITP